MLTNLTILGGVNEGDDFGEILSNVKLMQIT